MHSKQSIILLLLLLWQVYCEKQTMIWLCLERCGDTAATITAKLDVLEKVAPLALTAISFERYDLGNDSALIRNAGFTDVMPRVSKMKNFYSKPIRTMPMITTTNIVRMRQVFAKPEPFIDACVKEAQLYGYTGYNIDWEPEHGVVSTDAYYYAVFLSKLSFALGQHKLELSVDVASWSVLYNFENMSHAIYNYPNNRMITMDTYAGTDAGWTRAFDRILANVTNHDMIGIGLMNTHPSDGTPLTLQELQWRVNQIQAKKLQEIDIWVMDKLLTTTDSFWWTTLNGFLKNSNNEQEVN